MSQALFDKLGLRHKDLGPYEMSSVGTAKDGASLKILGRLKRPLKMQIGHSKNTFSTRPIVIQGLSMPFNLSGPFLSRHKIDQIHSASSLKYKNQLLPLFSRQGVQEIQSIDVHTVRPLTMDLQLKHNTIVPPHSIAKIALVPTSNSPFKAEGDAIIAGSPKFSRLTDLHPPVGTLGRWQNGVIYTTVMNTLNETINVDKGQYFGEAKAANANDSAVQGVIAYIDKEKTIKTDEIEEITKPLERMTIGDDVTEEEVKKNRSKRWKWLKEQFKLDHSPFLKNSPTRMRIVLKLLERYYSLFSQGDTYGKTELIQHEIHTSDVPPIKTKGRPINPVMEGNLREQLDTWMDQGVVQPSTSPWSFPLIAVPKKNGKTRWVVDYRKLNEITIKDSFPLPNIEDNLSRLSNSQIFSGIDGAGAFHVIPIRDQDREKTAFSTPWGLFEFSYMPFGLCNAPATYSRLVSKVLEGIPTDVALPYLDDTCIHTQGFDEHIDSLERVFQAHEDAGLTLQPSKCQLFQTSIEYLGHTVSARGIAPIPRHLEIIKTWPFPETVTQLRTFFGKANYYRKFVPGYSKILNPLLQLLKGATKKSQPIIKTKEAEEAFEIIKKKLLESPILAYPQFWSEQPFILDTDWSRDHNSIGAVLSQVQDGEERAIIYGAKRLNSAQANYSSNKGEIFAAIHFINLWRYYLAHRKFTLRTDHQAMRWIRTMEEPKGMILRWLETLSSYDFDVVFRPGTQHGNADALSRVDHASEVDPRVLLDEPGQPGIQALSAGPSRRSGEIKRLQDQDPTLIALRKFLKAGKPPPKQDARKQHPDVQHYLALFEQLKFNSDGIIVREECDPFGQTLSRLCVPKEMQRSLSTGIHEEGGHMGINTTEARLKRHFHFPKIRDTITETIQSCDPCQAKKLRNKKDQRHTLYSKQAGYPFDEISIDFVGPFQRSTQGNTHLLTVRDRFTRWIEAFPMRDTKAKAVSRVLAKQVFARFGIPGKIHSDQGTNFTSELIRSVYSAFGIQATTTPAYNPKSNPVERVHQDLGKMLRALCGKRPNEWEDHVPAALFALRTAKNRYTGFTPYRLLFGREAAMPLDLVYGDPAHSDRQAWSTQDWAKELKDRCSKAIHYAQANLECVIHRARQRYYNKVNGDPIEENDLVWLITPKVPVGTSKKLHSPWTGPWKVTKKVTEVLFTIETEGAWSKKNISLTVSVDRLARYLIQDPVDGIDITPQLQDYSPEDFEVQDEFLEGGLEEQEDQKEILANLPPMTLQPDPLRDEFLSENGDERALSEPSDNETTSEASYHGDGAGIPLPDEDGDELEELPPAAPEDIPDEMDRSPTPPRPRKIKRLIQDILSEPDYYLSPHQGPPRRRQRPDHPN